ncbi:uncharacterized protein Nmag_2271 [Natrialba magadii ATCC 43099]|uniref:Lipoprotein n=1 Tax=Natrialba magadii (strain ATCC 43099 / DSM 3394 / CCM 3739 / CIP 104546 / IAM 13178 / JCM 8861 / NBRC 102185 / NCIMB 2190 / MS3) TaxID=547559 RepID=D3SWV4_NATMM|nr:hypothetical protein [Natrialba magadii]ADD05836.1 uncharacterized protein Nmag_2271 [Natrialba magadii ATCC 43099]
MIPRRKFLQCGVVSFSGSIIAGCSESTETSNPEGQSVTEPHEYPVLEASLIDERRPIDVYVFLNDELDDTIFRWDELSDSTVARLRSLIERGEDLLVFQSRISFNSDATTGFPLRIEFTEDHTIVSPRYSDSNISKWQGPSSWNSETGTVLIRGYDSIPRSAADRVKLKFEIDNQE